MLIGAKRCNVLCLIPVSNQGLRHWQGRRNRLGYPDTRELGLRQRNRTAALLQTLQLNDATLGPGVDSAQHLHIQTGDVSQRKLVDSRDIGTKGQGLAIEMNQQR